MSHLPVRSALADQRGMALLLSVLLMLLVAAIGLAAINHSGSESEGSGNARRHLRTFHAADAGIQYGRVQVLDSPPRLDAFQISLSDGTEFRSGPKAASAAESLPVPETGPPPDGFSINLGSANGGFIDNSHRFSVTATAPAGAAQVELETKISQTTGGYGSY